MADGGGRQRAVSVGSVCAWGGSQCSAAVQLQRSQKEIGR